ncbi:MAG: GDSL-type esterase/lipase family protein [Myxococcota bacterium]|nr:GDSL-type esterase/lipase family protein [Myxococcota bacterium]MEC9390566.1 GDSL-type esterase/lipase family protein [Myxococcota bacterium]
MTRSKPLLSLASLLAVVVVLEIVGRVAVPPPPEMRQDGFAADPVLGWALPASTTMVWRNKPAAINRLGLRGPDPRPDARQTILIVGDSSIFGDGVSDRDTLAAQMGRALGSDVDVQNGGVPGYTCRQSRILIERLSSTLQPDVLIAYNQHSDFRRASSEDRVIVAANMGMLRDTGIGRLLSAGMLWNRMRTNGSNLDRSEYEACLTALADTQRQHGGKTLFVVPITEVDFPDSPFYGEPEPEAPGKRLTDYRTSMAEVARATGSLLVDGPAVVVAAGLSGNAALQDPVHPTVAGHAALSAGIVAALREANWVGNAGN